MAVCRMSDFFDNHIPVLLKETVDHLVTSTSGIYVDATFGRGSHSRAVLNALDPRGRLIAFDKDPDAVAYAKHHIVDARFSIYHASFARLQVVLNTMQQAEKIDGILFDLGVSSPQLDNPARGFSFSRDGKLDMRMDTTQGVDAATWIASVDETTLADTLWRYGDENYSRRIARAIVTARKEAPISTTKQLADIIFRSLPRPKAPRDKHPATKSFQAIRIMVNQELTELELALAQSLEVLKVGGRMAVISFHSLEDRIVKQFIHEHEKGKSLPRGLPVKETHFDARLTSFGKAIKPSEIEIYSNPRARSAILRIAEKQS